MTLEAKARVSVVIPTYNSARTIGRALNSAFSQSFQNFEVIVADDASTDNTRQEVEKFSDNRLEFLPSPAKLNQGPAAARNRALAKASGTYTAFLDSDDEWFPEKLAKQANFLDAHPDCTIVIANAEDVSPDGRVVGYEFGFAKPQAGPEAWRTLLKRSFIETSSVMTRTALVRQIGGFDTRLLVSQDQDLWIRLALAGDVGILDEVQGRIHQMPSGHMTRNRHRSMDIMLPMIERHVQAQAARLSKAEIDGILGHRYQVVGRELFDNGHYGTGLKLLMKAARRQGNWLNSLFYLCHANPLGVAVKQKVRVFFGVEKSRPV